MYGLPHNVRIVPVISVCIYVFLPDVFFVFLHVGSYFLIYEFKSWITGVCSLYLVSLGDFTYYVVG